MIKFPTKSVIVTLGFMGAASFAPAMAAPNWSSVPAKDVALFYSGHTAKRFHYVSFERSLVLDQGSADFVATKQ